MEKRPVQQAQFGILLALIGALILTPDSLLMRLSQMDGGAMLAWRATLAGMVFLLIGLNKRSRSIDTKKLNLSKSFVALVLCQIANTSFFAFAISLAPVAIVLVAVATVPIISVMLSALFLGERASLRSWGIILTVMLGIIVSVYGDLRGDIDFNMQTVLGALLGLAVAFSLAINFIVVRQDRTVEFELALGIGALIAGLTAFALSSTATDVTLSSAFIISLTGLIILPVSFVMLTRASRYTTASNVSMLMLLETVLGPLWVWMVIDERPSHLTIAGGAIVILAIFYFLLSERKHTTLV
jgi:drug/metabolite transporter (DMT)-like permease